MMSQTNLPVPGALRHRDGSVEWNLWAPQVKDAQLLLKRDHEEQIIPMQRRDEWSTCHLPELPDGTRYRYQVDGKSWPDPASRWQPDGVHGDSALFTPELFGWEDHHWSGIPLDELVIYELHVGTFTSEGTLTAIIPRLRDLKDLGVTAIELMPVAQFPGARNWGYDGVYPCAVQNSYGGPRALQQLVNAAHQAGIGVLLDVVYNHLGPEGNYFSQFGPYFTSAYQTPWGQAVNYDGPDSDPVRRYVIENACMWIRDFHLDGLRLDAVHAIYDMGARHLLSALAEEVHAIGDQQQRTVHVIAESDRNDPRMVDSLDRGGMGLDAVWADDFHHSVLTWLTKDQSGYFGDFGTPEHLAKAFEEIYVYDGAYSPCRRRCHGVPVEERKRSRFVVCVHNHDQIGNRAFGDRPSTRLSPAAQRLMCGLLCISPGTPLLFMGEEYGETRPFPFFCSFTDPSLIEAVRKGRRQEFSALGFHWADSIPDPQAESTFESAKLTWNWPSGSVQEQLRRLYHDLLHLRRIDPGLRDRQQTSAAVQYWPLPGSLTGPVLIVRRGTGPESIALANLGAEPVQIPEGMSELRGRRCHISTENPIYGGARVPGALETCLFPFELKLYGH